MGEPVNILLVKRKHKVKEILRIEFRVVTNTDKARRKTINEKVECNFDKTVISQKRDRQLVTRGNKRKIGDETMINFDMR